MQRLLNYSGPGDGYLENRHILDCFDLLCQPFDIPVCFNVVVGRCSLTLTRNFERLCITILNMELTRGFWGRGSVMQSNPRFGMKVHVLCLHRIVRKSKKESTQVTNLLNKYFQTRILRCRNSDECWKRLGFLQ
jgi:hypothetical protein